MTPVIVHQIVVVITQPRRRAAFGGVGRIRDRWLIPDPAHALVPLPGSAFPVPSGTLARCNGPAPLPPTAPVECGSPSLHWLPRNYHRLTDASLQPIPLPHTAARSVRTTARTVSIPETDHAGSWRTSNGVESPDRS